MWPKLRRTEFPQKSSKEAFRPAGTTCTGEENRRSDTSCTVILRTEPRERCQTRQLSPGCCAPGPRAVPTEGPGSHHEAPASAVGPCTITARAPLGAALLPGGRGAAGVR